MAKSMAQLPCPECPYQALNEADLEGHRAHAHPKGGDGGPSRVLEEEASPEPAADDPPAHPALVVPEADDTFWVDDSTVALLHTIGKLTDKGEVTNVLLTGPKGTGKTSLPKEFAAAQGRPFFTMHCQLITERDDWWGSKELSIERGTYFDRAAFLDAIETPGCVVLIDEANRTQPENLNALFGFLDHRRSAWVPQLKADIHVAPGVSFFVTLNEGFEYVGTNPIDEALRDRMTYSIRMRYVPKRVEKAILVKRTGVEEDDAEKLAEFARSVRRNPKLGVPVSTRQLLGASALIVEGMPIQEAVRFAAVNAMGEDVDRSALLQALQIVGKVDDAWVDGTDDEDGEQPW